MGSYCVAIGHQAGRFQGGADAVLIGRNAGDTNSASGSIVINASGISTNAPNAGACHIRPVRAITGNISDNPICYNPSTYELTYISGGQAGSFNIDGTYRNVGSALDNLATYMFFAQTDVADGTYTCAVIHTEEPVVSIIAGNNILLQFVATRQLQVRSSNSATYTMRWRLVKWIQA
jgi:hypothetical protein